MLLLDEMCDTQLRKPALDTKVANILGVQQIHTRTTYWDGSRKMETKRTQRNKLCDVKITLFL